jgi:SDR family mycofactocin-dependent oxidoreductase
MTGRVAGQVAFVTGAARGQGRSHAVRLAEEGADVVISDACVDIGTARYAMATEADLRETAAMVERLGRRVVVRPADVREQAELDAVVDQAIESFGRIDIVSANAGIASFGKTWELSEQTWRDVIDIDLTGCWHTAKAVAPAMIEGGRGSIVFTSSCAGVQGIMHMAHYTAAKHGVIGLMRTLANELGPEGIRVNAVVPGTVATEMAHNEPSYKLFRPDLPHPTLDDVREPMQGMNLLPVPWLDPIDVSNAILWLSSDEARYITGVVLPIDAGWTSKTT